MGEESHLSGTDRAPSALTAATATGFAGACLATLNGVFLALPEATALLSASAEGEAGSAQPVPLAVRLEAAAFGAAHLLGLGLFAAALAWCALRAARRFRRGARGSMRARLVWLAFAFAGTLALGALLLPRDLTNFSQRQTALPAWLVLALGVTLISAAVPAALAVGLPLRNRFGRAAAGGCLLVVAVGNHVLLPNDYFVIHLFLALTALALAASSWTGARLVGLPARAWKPLGGLALAGATAGMFLVPSAQATTALGSATGAVASPWVAEVRHWLAPPGSHELASEPPSRGPWFRSRSNVAAVPPSGPPLLGSQPVVVLITVDALRADVVNSGKYDDRLPHFAELRRRGVWFSNARATGSLTKMSIAGLMFGTHFIQQYWVVSGSTYTPTHDPTERFPERLKKAGVRTVNFRTVRWLRNKNVLEGFAEETLIRDTQGKQLYAPSPLVFAKLLPRVAAIGPEPTFLYTHLADPHAPYDLGESKGSNFERYLAEVAVVDEQLGRLLDTIERSGLAERTALIVSADHGEAFGEHKSRTHGTTVYDEVLRVPLLAVLPKATPRRVDTPVSLIDLGPTVLDLFGQETPGYMMGQSLVPFLRGENRVLERPIVAETRRMQAWLTPENRKLIFHARTGRTEFYDLEADPLESQNLAGSPEAAQALADLKAFVAAHRLQKPGYEPPYFR
jgi:hypothetical protein